MHDTLPITLVDSPDRHLSHILLHHSSPKQKPGTPWSPCKDAPKNKQNTFLNSFPSSFLCHKRKLFTAYLNRIRENPLSITHEKTLFPIPLPLRISKLTLQQAEKRPHQMFPFPILWWNNSTIFPTTSFHLPFKKGLSNQKNWFYEPFMTLSRYYRISLLNPLSGEDRLHVPHSRFYKSLSNILVPYPRVQKDPLPNYSSTKKTKYCFYILNKNRYLPPPISLEHTDNKIFHLHIQVLPLYLRFIQSSL